jgi:outer membrane protein TolC
MKRAVFPIALATALAATAASAEPERRTLAELIQIAQKRSRHVAVAKADREVRYSQKAEALWSLAPSLDITGGIGPSIDIRCQPTLADEYLQANDPKFKAQYAGTNIGTRDCVSTTIPQGNLPFSSANVDIIRYINGAAFQGDLRLTMPIFTFGKIKAANTAADYGIAYADAQIEGAQAETELWVARAYWALKGARAAVATITDIRDRLRPWVERIEQDLEAPKPKYTLADLRRGQIGLQQIELLLDDQERNERTARDGLAILVGPGIDTDEAELEPVEIVEHPLEHYTGGGHLQRPEARAYEQGVTAFHWLSRFSLTQMLPDLAIVGTLGGRTTTSSVEDSQSFYQSHTNYWYAGLALALRGHFDLAQVARYQHARADAAVIAAQRDLAVAGFTLEIAQSFNDLRESRRRIEITDKAQRLARGWFNSLDGNLEGATPFELIDSARNYFDMRLRYIQAIYDTNVNVARLRRASGMEVAR